MSTITTKPLDKAWAQWRAGEWESLAKLEPEAIEQEAGKAELALLAGAALFQLGKMPEAKGQITRARKWGAGKRLVGEVLVAGVQHTLGSVSALDNDYKIIRTIHHFACTGGTLITRCLACSPGVRVLSEVDPLSTHAQPIHKFTPTDLISLTLFSNHPSSIDERVKTFLAALGAVHKETCALDMRMLMRDHAHSHFCVGSSVAERPTLKEIIEKKYKTLSIVTVRHPIDSWLSLVHNKWVSFSPESVDEYAQRYELFLDKYSDERIFRYEDFVERPDEELRKMCRALHIPFSFGWKEKYNEIRLSGDSGRKSENIVTRPRKPMSDELESSMRGSSALQRLIARLDYE